MTLLIAMLAGMAQSGPPLPNDLVIEHVAVVDVAAGRILADRTVVIRDRRIVAMARGTVSPRPGAVVVDGRDRYLIPGLWDMHVHFVSFRAWADAFLPVALANGILGVRDMHSRLDTTAVMIRELAQGTRIGPRVFASGEALDGPKSALPAARVVGSEAEARAAVRAHKAGGARFIKVYAALPKDLYLAIADEAKQQGLPFAGHVPYAVTAEEATAAGQKSIEHLSGVEIAVTRDEAAIQAETMAALEKGQFPVPDAARLMATYDSTKAAKLFRDLKRNQTWQVPTLVVFRQLGTLANGSAPDDSLVAYVPPRARSWWPMMAGVSGSAKALLPFHQVLVGQLDRAGVPILAGSDSPNPYVYPGFGLHDELTLLVGSGLSPAALRAATIAPARYLGITDSLGTVAIGKVADLVLLDADPLADIASTRRIQGVIQGGRWMPRATLDSLLIAVKRSVQSQDGR